MSAARCKGCGKEILFAADPSGRLITLDTKPPVYQLADDGEHCERARGFYVSHFATCPDAQQFSGKGKAQKELPR